jgi:hypothetical protein
MVKMLAYLNLTPIRTLTVPSEQRCTTVCTSSFRGNPNWRPRQSERRKRSGLFPSRHIAAGPAGVRCHLPAGVASRQPPAVAPSCPNSVTTYLATRRRSVRPPPLTAPLPGRGSSVIIPPPRGGRCLVINSASLPSFSVAIAPSPPPYPLK